MITKFIRKRNTNTNLPFSKNFARVQVHSDGGLTFRFRKIKVSTPSTTSRVLTELGDYLNTENLNRITTD